MIRRLHPCFSAGWSRFFCARMWGKPGLWKKNKENHSLLWKYYDCACAELRTFVA